MAKIVYNSPIKEQDLVPLITEGDVKDAFGRTVGFSKDRFSSTCASYIRSGYPALIVGRLVTSNSVAQHAICNVGFRSCIPSKGDPLVPDLADSNIEILYVHDDNLGPNVRLRISLDTKMSPNASREQAMEALQIVSLHPEPPPSTTETSPTVSPTDDYGTFVPTQLIVAAHSEIRTDPDTLHKAALRHVSNIAEVLNHLAESTGNEKFSFAVSSRFIRVTEYLGVELQNRLSGSSRESKSVLAAVRLALTEKINPMSLHIAVVRIGLNDATVLVDILYDTTDSDRNHPIFGHVAYNELVASVIQYLQEAGKGNYGVCVGAY